MAPWLLCCHQGNEISELGHCSQAQDEGDVYAVSAWGGSPMSEHYCGSALARSTKVTRKRQRNCWPQSQSSALSGRLTSLEPPTGRAASGISQSGTCSCLSGCTWKSGIQPTHSHAGVTLKVKVADCYRGQMSCSCTFCVTSVGGSGLGIGPSLNLLVHMYKERHCRNSCTIQVWPYHP